jgi:hypothetical protein
MRQSMRPAACLDFRAMVSWRQIDVAVVESKDEAKENL